MVGLCILITWALVSGRAFAQGVAQRQAVKARWPVYGVYAAICIVWGGFWAGVICLLAWLLT